SRLIDRALRPLFPEDYFCEVQVLVTLISSDPEVLPDALACLAASAALAVSDVPIKEVISEVRVARIDGAFKINPTRSEMENADMDFIVAATEKNLLMVEGESEECSEADLIEALGIAHEAIKVQIKAQEELRALKGVSGKREYTKPVNNEAIREKVYAYGTDKVKEIAKGRLSKQDRTERFKLLEEEIAA